MFYIYRISFCGLRGDIKTSRYKSILIGAYISFIVGLAVTVDSLTMLKPLYLSSLYFI